MSVLCWEEDIQVNNWLFKKNFCKLQFCFLVCRLGTLMRQTPCFFSFCRYLLPERVELEIFVGICFAVRVGKKPTVLLLRFSLTLRVSSVSSYLQNFKFYSSPLSLTSFFSKISNICLFLPTVAAHSDIPLYIGIAVAVVVFLAGAVVVYKLLQRKTRDHSLYTMTRTGKSFEFFSYRYYMKSQFFEVFMSLMSKIRLFFAVQDRV